MAAMIFKVPAQWGIVDSASAPVARSRCSDWEEQEGRSLPPQSLIELKLG